MDKTILVKFSTRSRPNKFTARMNELIDNAHNLDKIIFLISVDEDDSTMQFLKNSKPIVRRIIVFGKSESKIHAFNRDIEQVPEWDIMVVHSDDMRVVAKNWDEKIRRDFEEFCPNTDGIFHYPTDNDHGDRIITWPVIGRKYYDRTKRIFEPSYKSLYCDDEMTEVAKLLGKYRKIMSRLVIHDHYIYTGEQPDALMQKTQADDPVDKANYENRKANNFYLKP